MDIEPFVLPGWDIATTVESRSAKWGQPLIRSCGLVVAIATASAFGYYVTTMSPVTAAERDAVSMGDDDSATVVATDTPEITSPESADIKYAVNSIDIDHWEQVNYTRFIAVNDVDVYDSPSARGSMGSMSAGDRVTITRTALDGQWSRISEGYWVATKDISVADPTYVPVARSTPTSSAPSAPKSPPKEDPSAPQPRTFTHHVYTSGSGTSQEKVDACKGAVWSEYGAGVSIAEHNHCGGAWVLNLRPGDQVTLTGVGAGTYTVTGSKDVLRGVDSSTLAGGTWLQTCYFNSDTMRLVRIEKI